MAGESLFVIIADIGAIFNRPACDGLADSLVQGDSFFKHQAAGIIMPALKVGPQVDSLNAEPQHRMDVQHFPAKEIADQ